MTVLSDAELLELIRADLTASPFQGEGHRKAWARLRVRDGIKVGRRRVLRLMREHNLLSPYRGRRGSPRLHEGEIITQAPNLMWGTDGAKVFTSNTGGLVQVSPLSNNHRPMAWLNASTGPSKSRSSMAGGFKISRRLGRRSDVL